MNVGTTCVKYEVTKIPNVARVPNSSSIVKSINAIAKYRQADNVFLFAQTTKNCAAIPPANTDSIAAASCAIPYIQSYAVKIAFTSL